MAESVTEHVEKLVSEGAVGLAQAAKFFGTFRQGRPTSPATLFRWCVQGVKLPGGRWVRLEHLRIGNRLMTSRAACLRFLESQQPENDSTPQPPPPSARARRSAAAGKKLEKAGW